MTHALVLDAVLRQSLVTVRSLGRRGFRVAAFETTPDAPTFSSRWCQQTYLSPSPVGTGGYLDHLDHCLDTLRPAVIVPSHDGTIALIRRHRAQLGRLTAIALASEEAMTIAVDKERTLEVAARLGIPCPRGVLIRGADDVLMALTEIGLPAVIKPAESWAWAGESGIRASAELVTTPDEAFRVVDSLAHDGQVMLFQQLLTGRREAVSLLYAGGKVHARFAQWARRTGPPLGGQSVLRQSIAVPDDIGQQSERLIRAIDLEGYSEIEFRRDDDGRAYLMEVNPRLSASVEIAVRSGVDFPYLLYQWATGEPVDTVERYRTGLWMRYLRGDLMSTIAALRERGRPGIPSPLNALAGFGLSFFEPMAYDYADWRDPVPAVKAATGFIRDSLAAMGGGRLNRLWAKAQ